MPIFLVALASIVLSVAAQFALKAGMSSVAVKAALAQPLSLQTLIAVFTNPFVLGGFSLYGLGAVVWLSVLARWDVSKAYPLVGLGFGLTAIVGALMGEQIAPTRLLGIGLICAGVFFVGRS